MKKILITVLCILVFALILILLIVNFSSLGHDKSIRTARETFQKNNKDVEITDIQLYYGDQAYYIVFYKKNNIEFVGVLNKNYTKILEVEKSKLFNLEENSTLGYKDEKLIYEVKKNTKDGFTYSYYDALTGEFIKNIKLNK